MRRRAITVFNGVALGITMTTTARLLTVTTTTRTTATRTMASAWFAPRSPSLSFRAVTRVNRKMSRGRQTASPQIFCKKCFCVFYTLGVVPVALGKFRKLHPKFCLMEKKCSSKLLCCLQAVHTIKVCPWLVLQVITPMNV